MRLGLLVVLAVAALVPSLAESRIVSQRELKVMLLEKLDLPPFLQKYKKVIVGVVVCEMTRWSQLKTDFVKVFGFRRTTTAKPVTKATTSVPPAVTNRTTLSTRPTLAVTDEEGSGSGMTMASEDMLNQEENKFDEEGSGSGMTMTMEDMPNQEESQFDEEGSGSGMPMTIEDKPNQEENKFVEEGSGSGMTMTMEDELNQEENKFDEEEMMQDDNSNKSIEEEGMENSRRKRSFFWSLGYYGIFRLTDSHFCYSGYRWSRNVCRTSCTNFTDDDITDDVDCFLKTGLWRYVLRNASRKCWQKYYFF